jgi:hypothetical protein
MFGSHMQRPHRFTAVKGCPEKINVSGLCPPSQVLATIRVPAQTGLPTQAPNKRGNCAVSKPIPNRNPNGNICQMRMTRRQSIPFIAGARTATPSDASTATVQRPIELEKTPPRVAFFLYRLARDIAHHGNVVGIHDMAQGETVGIACRDIPRPAKPGDRDEDRSDSRLGLNLYYDYININYESYTVT